MANNIQVDKITGEINALNKSIKTTSELMSELITKQDKLNKELAGAKNLKQVNDQLNKSKSTANEIEKEGEKLLKKRNSLMAKQDKSIQALTRETIKQNEKVKEQNRLYREQAKADLGLKKRSGLFKSMTKSIIAASGAMLGLAAAFRVLKDAGKLVREFQKENAVLAGVLNKTRKEITALTEDAKRLGGTTAKTAKEVTALQIAYARLGFTQSEILNLTEDTINGSIALNAELDETAELTGAMVRSFDELSTTDADVILDQLTLSTQKNSVKLH